MVPQCTLHLSASNMTSSALILLAVACFLVRTNSIENIYSDNGWRPMSNEKVFELQRNFIKTPSDVRIMNVQGNSMDNFLQKENAIKIVQPNHLTQSIKEHEAIFTFEAEKENNERDLEDTSRDRYFDVGIENNKINHVRKAKKISDTNFKLETDNNLQVNNMEDDKTEETTEITASKVNKRYEVKEILDEELNNIQHDLKPRNKFIQKIGYKYKYQEPKEIKPKNLTSNLFNILANYNIRRSDKLPNYALSLRQNSRNSNNDEFFYMHVPVKIPLRYNSPSHFPVDPLLAVFLSNYGYYLPGLYGYQHNFNNLYGNLAANNIHNNKPFGSYKVFSDTDSFH